MKRLLLIGGGGHCKAAIDAIETAGRFSIQGVVQPKADGVESVLGYPVLGEDADLPALLADEKCAFVTVGQIKTPDLRQRLFERLQSFKIEIPVIVSARAYVSRHTQLGEGTLVMHGAVVNAAAQVGVNNIVNTLALIEHDTVIGNHCHISTGARINGGAIIEDGCFIGSGAILHQGVRVCARSVIGAGCVVRGDIAKDTTVKN